MIVENAVIIEDAMEQFKQQEGRVPQFSELVNTGCLAELPADPYGGEWILLPIGRVFSTSKFAEKRDK